MTISMYQASVPVFSQMMGNLVVILEKAAAHAEANKIDSAVLVQARLYPDMFPMARQVMIATDNAKGCIARLAGVEPPRYEDNESTFPQLVARLNKTIDFISGFKPTQIDGSEERDISFKWGPYEINMKGQAYLLHFATRNFYFHITTAYAILRHHGVPVGKQDFMGG